MVLACRILLCEGQIAMRKLILAVFALLLWAAVPRAAEPEVKHAREGTVRPCNNREWQIAFGEEARKLTQGDLEDFGGFNSCEAAELPFLQGATMLRLHTPVDVDYSITALLFRPDSQSPLRHLSHCRGMCALETWDNPESIEAINYLFCKATVKPSKDVMRTIAALDLFLLDAESGGPFWAAIATKERTLGGVALRSEVELGSSSAEVFLRKWGWRFRFAFAGGRVQLLTVKRDSE